MVLTAHTSSAPEFSSPGLELVAAVLSDILADEDSVAALQVIIGSPARRPNCGTMPAQTNPQVASEFMAKRPVMSHRVQVAAGSSPREQLGGPSQTACSSPLGSVPRHKRARRSTSLEEGEIATHALPHLPVDSLVHRTSLKPPERLGQCQGSMILRGQALDVARHRIGLVHTDIEVRQVVGTLAMALGAKRTETGTIKALHAVLLQLVWPAMSNVEVCDSTACSFSNFTKWKRLVQHVQLMNMCHPPSPITHLV